MYNGCLHGTLIQVKQALRKGHGRLRALKNAGVSSRLMSPEMIEKIMSTVLFPAVEYGLHLMTLSKEAHRDLERLRAKVGRLIMGVGDEIGPLQVQGELGWKSVKAV